MTDVDGPPALGGGTDRALSFKANLILGDQTEKGSGGGLALQTSPTDVEGLPTTPTVWRSVNVTKNILASSVFGRDAGGVSLLVNMLNVQCSDMRTGVGSAVIEIASGRTIGRRSCKWVTCICRL